MKTTSSIPEATPERPAAQATSQRSIWKEGPNYRHVGLHDGPQSKLSDVGYTLDARYTPEEGVHFFFEIEQRPTASYSLAEIRKLHGAMGRVLDRVAADPKPRPAIDTLAARGGDRG